MTLPPLPPELDPRGRSRRGFGSNSASRSVKVTVRIVSAVVSLSLIVAFGYGWSYYRSLNSGIPRVSIANPNPGTGAKDIDGKDENLLIAGNDDRSNLTDAQVKELHVGRDGGSLATDTMMIVHIPADGSKATLISLPRDSYVDIPGYGMNRLNAAYADGYTHTSGTTKQKISGGANLLIKTIYNLTGLTINHFVQVTLLGFVTLSDAVGGVTVNLCHAVDDTVARNKAEGSDGGSGLVLSAGKHTISGVQALEFVRQRHNLPNGDLDRTARQRYFLTAAFRKVASVGIVSRLGQLKTAIQKSLYVDDGLNLTSLASQMADLSANNIKGVAIPFDRFDTVSIGGSAASVEIVEPAKVKAFVNKLINDTPSALSKAKTVAPSTVTVSVLNGGSVNGAAGTAAGVLTGAGFHATVGNAPASQESTTINYASGMESQAKTLAEYVPGAVLEQRSVSTLTLVLGADGLKAKVPTTASGSTTPSASSSTATKAVDSGCIN
ncbi:LCP family protein [Jatrophihabitans sp.]|uniref:LCP family protein n=1 Tax=Jatrophihabitans sp. TaxID=1932789 RepID=UPI0030C6AE98|nr:Transcriptional attenuator, LytR family [Jatrophihabitans sp.]